MAQKTIDELAEDLRSFSVHKRVDAAKEMGKLGDRKALEHLVAALADKEATVRDNAAFALGELKLPEAVPHLIKLLQKDGDEWVRKGAAKALGMLGSAKAADALITALNADASFIVRRAAARSLGRIGGRDAVDSLNMALRDRNITVRDMARRVLGEMGEG